MLNSRIINKEISGKLWKCIVIDYRDETGKKKQKCLKTDFTPSEYERGKKKIVEKIRTEFVITFQRELEQKQGKSLEYTNLTVKELLVLYAESRKTHVSPDVYSGYYAMMKKMDAFLANRHLQNIKLRNFTADLYKEFYIFVGNMKNRKKEPLSNNTIKHVMAFYNPAFRMAYENDYIDKDITKTIKAPPVKRKEIVYLNEKDYKKFLEVADQSKIGFVLKLALLLGVRRSELLGLKWDDIDFEKEQISICRALHYSKRKATIRNTLKTESSQRVLPFIANIKELLLQQKAIQEENKRIIGKRYCLDKRFKDFICVDNYGNIIKPDRVSREASRISKANNLPNIHLHSLRHSCASLFLSSGVDMKVIQTWLGHSNFSTTADIYSHLDLKDKRLAVDKVSKILAEKSA